jgi:hypothetical protein
MLMICGLSLLFWFFPTNFDSNYCFFFFFSDKRPEQSIASARASVMIYDDLNKKWVPSGTSHGLSKVHIYHHFINNTFRVVGRKLQDHEVRTLSLNLSGGQKKVSWRHLLFLYYVLSYFVCFLPILHTVSYFRVQFPVRRILMHCAVFDTLDKIVLFFWKTSYVS